MRRSFTIVILPIGLLASALAGACTKAAPVTLSGSDGSGAGGPGQSDGVTTGVGGGTPAAHTALDDRTKSYPDALRTASLKLIGTLPTLAQVKALESASDQAKAYSDAIDALFADPRFNTQMVKFWRDAMRIGGDAAMDTAPVLAAQIISEGRPYTDLFTQSKGTCPTFDGKTGAFTSADCQNGLPAAAGVLTNPGVMKQFFSNMGFRRVRWVQETFVCTKFPAEVKTSPTQIDGKDYTSPWDFHSVATMPINFQDTKSVVCANCHTTINHVAPLFGYFDDQGMHQGAISVMTPVVPTPTKTQMSDWLRAGEKTSWRNGEEVADLPALGQAMAKDPDVAACAVARMWNFTMSKEDIVNDLATVPSSVIATYLNDFTLGQMNLKATLKAMLLSDDFTKF